MRAAVLLLLDSSSSRKIDNRSRAIQQQQHQKTETAEDWPKKAKRSTKKILCRSVEQIRNHTLGGRVAKVFNCAIVNVNGQLQPPYPTPSSALASIKQTHTLTHSLTVDSIGRHKDWAGGNHCADGSAGAAPKLVQGLARKLLLPCVAHCDSAAAAEPKSVQNSSSEPPRLRSLLFIEQEKLQPSNELLIEFRRGKKKKGKGKRTAVTIAV